MAKRYIATPSENQIEKVEFINSILNISFPQSSEEFDKRTYQTFINTYYDLAKVVENQLMEEMAYEDSERHISYPFV
jgi:hypothetical protein